ncbi:MAG: hypothetical protein DRR42_24890 [Gammaproteobacteria bacterium]|nr:MAG: hypothetical protein DRR42_24890 [Gammaproteobacteria bacterium]
MTNKMTKAITVHPNFPRIITSLIRKLGSARILAECSGVAEGALVAIAKGDTKCPNYISGAKLVNAFYAYSPRAKLPEIKE